jgi:ribosomal protein S18 acetylase RimI-like enzyme
VVTSDLRNQGIGRALLRYALARASSGATTRPCCKRESKSEAKHRFYRSCGFSQTDKVAIVARDRHRPEAVMSVDMERLQRIIVALVDTAAEA